MLSTIEIVFCPIFGVFAIIAIIPIILNFDDQHVSFTINFQGMDFCFYVIYASTYYVDRRNLWLTLSNANPKTPWSFMEDFNAIISDDEYKGSHTPSKIAIVVFFI